MRVVQPGHARPEPAQQVVGDLPGRDQVQRASRHQVHDQQRGAVRRHDDAVHPRRVDARPFGQYADQGLVLDGLPQRGGRPPVAHVLEPNGPVGPVQQVGLALIRAEHLDEQLPPVCGDRHERPRALGRDPRRADRADRQAGRGQRRRDPVRSQPPVGDADRDPHPEACQQPGGTAGRQLRRTGRAARPGGRAPGQQHDPGRQARPGPQPGLRRDAARHRHRRQPGRQPEQWLARFPHRDQRGGQRARRYEQPDHVARVAVPGRRQPYCGQQARGQQARSRLVRSQLVRVLRASHSRSADGTERSAAGAAGWA